MNLVLLLGLIACSPGQKFFFKEKIIETRSEPKSGLHYDSFLYQTALGPVDILFVVDNTEFSEAYLADFQKGYIQFLNLFSKNEAHLLDYRVQVISTPKSSAPKNWISPELPHKPQLDELFFGTLQTDNSFLPPILNHRETGFPEPETSTIIGASHKAFVGHERAPLFVIYLMSDEAKETLVGNLQPNRRGDYQVHSWILSRTSTTTHPSSYPYCHTFRPAPKFIERMGKLSFASQRQVDLCDTNWPQFFGVLFEAVLNFKSLIILTNPPHEPATMLLRSPTHLYRFGEDFEFDPIKNEIRFLLPPALSKGDQLSLSYYLEPPQQTLPGVSNPHPPSTLILQ